MGTVTRLDFESGVNGDAITPANTGFTNVSVTGGTGVISTAQAMNGSRSILFNATSTSGTLYGWTTLATASTSCGVDVYLYITAAPSASTTILSLLNSSTRQVSLELSATRTLVIRDGAAAAITTGLAGIVIPLNTWVRVSLFASQSATTGSVRAAFFTGNSATPTADSGLLTNQNTGASAYNTVRYGPKASTSVTTMAGYMDLAGLDPAATGLNPPFGSVPPTLGTAAVGYDYAWVTIAGTTFATGPGGIFSASPSSGTFPGPTGVVVPRVVGADTTYTITATDNGSGATASTSVVVTKAASGTADGVEIVEYISGAWA